MRIKAIKDEAKRLVQEHGDNAGVVAFAAMAQARRQRNLRMEQYMGKVAIATARLIRPVEAEAGRRRQGLEN